MKKYLSKLNKEEVSTDLLYSSALLAQQVELYRARAKYFGEISALDKKLQARQLLEENLYKLQTLTLCLSRL